MRVKNNKMLFNSRNWFKFSPLIFNSVGIVAVNHKKLTNY